MRLSGAVFGLPGPLGLPLSPRCAANVLSAFNSPNATPEPVLKLLLRLTAPCPAAFALLWPGGAEIWPRSMPKSLMGGDVDVSAGLAWVNAPSRTRGASNGGEGPPLEPWCCLCQVHREKTRISRGAIYEGRTLNNSNNAATRSNKMLTETW